MNIPGNSCYGGTIINNAGSGVVVVGNNGRIRLSNNSGLNWTFPVSNTTNSLNSVTMPFTNLIFIAGDNGTILKSTNGGVNWATQTSGTVQNLKCISFIDAITGWAVGQAGIVLRTGIPLSINSNSNQLPKQDILSQNFPNPFNPSTKIAFEVVKDDFVTILIYNSSGMKIETLLKRKLERGSYEISWDGSEYPSGIYFYVLKIGLFSDSKKMILLK